MDSELRLVHGSLETASAHLRGDGTDYAAALRRLRQRGDAASWGDDGLLRPLVTAYSECTAIALAAYTHMSDLMGSTGDALALSSRRVSDVNEATVQDIGDLTDTSWV
ncbi:hypothetical protein Nocox_39930 [Nonomuraea coxensis DSM 45129]|uniref:Uncharacterized protein n=1 Tax=Nonomuraea coxensis DSM 45129 TaxID=1122611 RepID=A0ABX8UCM6_9ACTN|nr:hypothetical protein [Nonomuraea coxensis]QYC45529.1 hypothetical protein Nocox_39930 [Nonomuraea coxensis DSM 45129]